jgi:hypothetical protein
MTLREILEIENDAEILSFRCPETGWIAWPTVRHAFLLYLIDELAYRWSWAVRPPATPWEHRAALAAVARCIPHNVRARRRGIARRPIVIFASTGTLVPWEGQAFNRVSDHFALDRAEHTCAYEAVSPLRYEVPRDRANPSVLYTLPWVIRRYVTSACRRRERFEDTARRLTAFLAHRAERLFGLKVSAERSAMTRTFIAKGLSRYGFERRWYERIFAEGRPRLLLATAGSQGSLAAAIQVAHALGIPVAECQHGQSGGGQPEYNFAPAVRDDPEYRSTLPDYFMSYGRWWTERMNAPMQTVVIGNPHRTERLAILTDGAATKDGTEILVVAKHGEPERYVALAAELARGMGGRFTIALRPDPRDRPSLLGTYPSGRIGPIVIDQTPDYYVSLTRAEIVVSGPSTTLAEAIGIARRIFIWEQAGAAFKYPDGMYETFATADELIESLQAPAPATLAQPAPDDIWAPEWRDRYRRFVEPFLA